MTQTSRQSTRTQPTQFHTTANSRNEYLQWLTNINPLITNQPPHTTTATAIHH